MSAHIAIKCDGCGKIELADLMNCDYAALEDRVMRDGWELVHDDLCPFCAARRKATEQAEAT